MARIATARRGSSQIWYRTLALAVLAAVIYSGVAISQALTATDLGGGTESIRIERETFETGLEDILVVDNRQLVLQATDETAAGDTPPGVEAATAPYPDVRTSLTTGNYTFAFDVHEIINDGWQKGVDNFTYQVYGYDGVDTTLLATLYSQQDKERSQAIEGVTVSVDSGSTVQDAITFSIVVSRQ